MSRMRNIKLISGMLLAAILIASCATPTALPQQTAAITQQPQSGQATTAPVNQLVTEADGYAGPPLTTEKITLRVLRLSYSDAVETLRKEMIQEFQAAYPNITIQEEVIPFGELYRKIQAVVAAGDPPDIIFYDGPNTKTYTFNNLLLPIDDLVTEEYKQDYVPASMAELSYKGNLYGFAERQSSVALNYNCDMTKAAGINPPSELENAWTFDQALEAWQKLQQDPSGSGNPTVWGLAPSLYGQGGPGFYYRDGIWLRSMGDPNAPKDSSAYKTFAAVSEDGSTVKGYLDSPEAIEGAQWFQNLTMKWNVTPKVGIPNSFLDKKAASDIRGENQGLQSKQAYPNGDFCFDSTPIPYFKTELTMGGSTTAAITAKSQHPNEAAAYLIYIYGDKGWIRYFQAGGFLPARLSLFEKIPELKQPPYLLFYKELANIAVPRPNVPGWVEYDAIVSPALKDIALGADPAERLHQAADEVDAQLAKYK